MDTILNKLMWHDPSVVVTEADIQTAFEADAVGALDTSHLNCARLCLITFLAQPDDFYLTFARMELLKVRWTK